MTGAAAFPLALLVAGVRAPAQVPVVEVRAVPEFAAVRPGAPFRVAIELRIPPGWHIGWFNPGAGGLATTITWRTPKGIEVRETAWPYPETDDAGAEISHVYRGTVVIFSSFGATRDLSAPLHLSAELEWGLCQEQCVRQRRTVDVSVAIARGAPKPSGPWRQVALAQRALPVRLPSDQVVARVAGDSATVILTALANGPAAESWATFFPVEPGRASVVAQLHAVAGGVALTLPASVVTGTAPGRIAGVLVAAHAPGAPPPVRPLAIDAQAIR